MGRRALALLGWWWCGAPLCGGADPLVARAPPASGGCHWRAVFHAHETEWSETFKRRVLRAQSELGARGCGVVVVAAGVGAGVPGVGVVDGAETAAFSRRFPSLAGDLAVAKGTAGRMTRAYGGWKGDRGLILAGALLPDVAHYWNLESDVEWKGDLYEILSSWDERAEDLLCVDYRTTPYDWPHVAAHDGGDWLAPGDKRDCMLTVARVSTKLLEAAAAVAAESGRRAYLELRLPSECARHARLYSNCSAAPLFAGATESRKGGLFTFAGSRRHRRFAARSGRLADAFAAGANGTLWHPVKDRGPWALSIHKGR